MKNSGLEKEERKKFNFFKLVWYSISKFEKYPEMASLGVKKALVYFLELMIIFSIVFTFSYVYTIKTSNESETTISAKIIEKVLDNYNGNDEHREELMRTFGKEMGNSIILILFISFFISIALSTFLDVITLSAFGVLTCFIAKIKINYKAIFNMSIFALTLSIILGIIYLLITMFTDFEIKYFSVMYSAISYIILAAAIFMIKSDVIKQQLKLINIIEESKEKLEQTINIPKKPKEEEENEGEEEEQKEETPKDTGGEQGSNA